MNKIPVTIPYFTEDEGKAVERVLASGWVAQGPVVTEFEKDVATHEQIGYGVATTSCTTALHLAMHASGMTRGMDAIVPAFTFVATANAVVTTGATPVFVDIDRNTFNISIESLESVIATTYERKDDILVNKKTGNILWGIVPVHEFGLCCNINEVNRIAQDNNLKVIEDAACALGARIGNRHEGAFGNTSCISFHPRKSITTGEGGMVLTSDEVLAKRMRELRTHGSTVSADARDKGKGFLLPEYNEAGYNYRMTDIQAAVGREQIKKLDYIIETKRRNASRYNNLLAQNVPEFIVPYVPEGYYHTYQSYVCMLDVTQFGISDVESGGSLRNLLLQRLEDLGIATRQGTHCVPMLGYYRNMYGYKPEDYPNAYVCDHLSITLPNYVQMTEEDQDRVIATIRQELDKLRKEM